MSSGQDERHVEVSVDLSDQALDWIVRLHSGAMRPVDHAAWQEWRQTSPAHEAAAQEAELIWQGIGSAGSAWGRKRRNNRITRRALIGGGAAVVVAGGLNQLGVLGTHLLAEYQTATAERRNIRLEDGTSVVMNARTALSSMFGNGGRGVSFYRGQAFFDVDRHERGPFHVSSGGHDILSLGGAFDIDLNHEHLTVTVFEGRATLIRAGRELHLSANQRLRVGYGEAQPQVDLVDGEMAGAWRRGKLIFNRRSLADLAVELERYRGGRILILSDQLAALEVSGVFDLSDPDAVLETIQMSLPVQVSYMPMLAVIRSV